MQAVQHCCGAVCSVVAMGRARCAGGYLQREVTARGRRIWPDTFRRCVSREQFATIASGMSILLKSSPPKMRDTTFQSTLGPAQPRPRVGATRRTYVRACAKKNSIAARARAATGSPLPALGRGSSWGRRRLNARASRAASTSARLPRTFSFLRVVRFGAFAPTAARRGRARPRVLDVRAGTLPAISAASSVRAVASAGARACARGRRPCSPAGRPRAVRSPYRPPPTPRPKSACLVHSMR